MRPGAAICCVLICLCLSGWTLRRWPPAERCHASLLLQVQQGHNTLPFSSLHSHRKSMLHHWQHNCRDIRSLHGCNREVHCTDISRCVAVAAVQDFCYLHEDICQNWGQVPQAVLHALVPERAVEHSKKMLPRDYRMRIFMPKDCQHGAMYLCQQAQVDLANSARCGTSPFSYCCC